MISSISFERKEYLKKKRTKRMLKIGAWLFVCILVFFGCVYLSHIQKFRITTVKLSGGVLVRQDEIATATNNFLSGSYLWFFPKNNDLLYPKSALEKMLLKNFPRIDTISIHLENSKTLDINITERPFTALWCDGLPNSSSSCYFMDNVGTIFAPAPEFSGDAYFKYYGLISATTSPIGQRYMASSTEFQGLDNIISRATSVSLVPVYLSAGDEGEFIIGLSNGGYLYVSTEQSLSQTADNLQALIQTLSASTTFSISNLDYIDLRFGDKLYYKMKN